MAGVEATRSGAEYAAAIREGRITDEDLAAALEACPRDDKPADVPALKAALSAPTATVTALPTVADLAAAETVPDWD